MRLVEMEVPVVTSNVMGDQGIVVMPFKAPVWRNDRKICIGELLASFDEVAPSPQRKLADVFTKAKTNKQSGRII